MLMIPLSGVSFAQVEIPAAQDTTVIAANPTVWDLAIDGGIFMIPIACCSIVVIAFAIERMIGLRTNKVLPPQLLAGLQEINVQDKGLDARKAYRLCQESNSPMANVVRTAILKIGRPFAEVEKAVEDSVAREAAKLANNIRPINVCASISPLLGLLGTVQGMIMAFMVTSTTTSTGTAKAQELAKGIYTALVTTFSGLCVAILAILLAHYLEGCIDRLLRDMEQVFLEILPQFETFEGKMRVARKGATPVSQSEIAIGTSRTKSTSEMSDFPEREVWATLSEEDPATPKGSWSIMGGSDEAELDEREDSSDSKS